MSPRKRFGSAVVRCLRHKGEECQPWELVEADARDRQQRFQALVEPLIDP